MHRLIVVGFVAFLVEDGLNFKLISSVIWLIQSILADILICFVIKVQRFNEQPENVLYSQ